MPDKNAERLPLGDVPAKPEEVLDLLGRVSADLRRIDAERAGVRDRLGQLITLAHDHVGYSWVDIARAAEFANGAIAQQWATPLVEPMDIALPGVTAAEAAAQLGIALDTVYAWIKSGRLESTKDPSGRVRVILPPSRQ